MKNNKHQKSSSLSNMEDKLFGNYNRNELNANSNRSDASSNLLAKSHGSVATYMSPSKTKLSFNQYSYGMNELNSNVKTKTMDFSSVLGRLVNSTGNSNINNSYFISDFQHQASTNNFTELELLKNNFSILSPKNRLKNPTSFLSDLESSQNILIKESPLRDYSLKESFKESFKPPPQIATIKNREKVAIRNKRLFINQAINLPKINYKVNSKIKPPEIRNSENKIKELVHKNLMKTLVSPNKSIHETDENSQITFENNTKSDLSEVEQNLITETLVRELDEDGTIKHLQKLKKQMNKFDLQIKNKKDNSSKENSVASSISSDYDQHIEIKTKKDIQNLKKSIIDIRKSENIPPAYPVLSELHRKIQNSYFENDKNYKNLKNIFSQYKRSLILDRNYENKNYGKLYLLNKNSLFQINNCVSYPMMMQDSNILAKIYNLNTHKLEMTAKKYKEKD